MRKEASHMQEVETVVGMTTATQNLGLTAPRGRKSDIVDSGTIAEAVISIALEYCAEKVGHGDVPVVSRLREGEPVSCAYYRYGVAKTVAKVLGDLDEHVRAGYVLEYDATPEDRCFTDANTGSLVHLILWAQPKSKALEALIETVGRTLTEHHARLMGTPQLGYLIDVQVIDDDDVRLGRGYAALLRSVHSRPITVWERQ
jgi:hypothetical protein